MVGIVDEALKPGNEDALKISSYRESLVDFIKRTDTPMTIGVQGEWGSGKTSLLNQIWNQLEDFNRNDNSIPDFKQIWINSWEHSLLCSPEESLLKIINEIIQDLLITDTDKNRAEKISSGVQNIMKGALRIGGSVAFGAAGTDAVDNIFQESSNSIKELRAQLSLLVEEIKTLKTNPFGKVIIYVDDLDRIEPRDAVRILELLKNIFNIKDCVFVLAIDYQVVVKGLKDKFGEQTQENEWEFRAFFDKIIQLPFTMPMGNYDIANYVIDLLSKIDFYSNEKEELDNDLIKNFVELSIGGNPRSIKRLINSLALIKIFNDKQAEEGASAVLKDKDTAMIMFAMVCLQIAHPEIYEMLATEPNFTLWDDELAYKITQKKEEQDSSWGKNFEQAKGLDDFDTSWEQCLFRVCYSNPRYRAKASHISQFLTVLENEFDKEKLSELILTGLGQTAVTSITTKENPNIRPPKGSFKRHFNSGYDDWLVRLKEDYKNPLNFPSPESEEVVQNWINILKGEPFNAVDSMSEEESDYVIKYAGAISVNYKKKKIGQIGIERKKDGEKVRITATKHPKHDNLPLIFTQSNIEFTHLRKLYDLDEKTRECKGAYGFIGFMHTYIDAKKHSLPDKIIKFLIEESSDAKTNFNSELISEKKIEQYVEAFKNKREDSDEFKQAAQFLTTYFESENNKKIDM